MTKVLFICLGNICRSPLAEGHFRNLVEAKSLANEFSVDSAGTSRYNIGEQPDHRTRKNAEKHGLTLNHKARQITPSDLTLFDYLVVMDNDNRENLVKLLTENGLGTENLFLLRQFDPKPGDGQVPDPYYFPDHKFEEVYQIVDRSNPALLDFILEKAKKQ